MTGAVLSLLLLAGCAAEAPPPAPLAAPSPTVRAFEAAAPRPAPASEPELAALPEAALPDAARAPEPAILQSDRGLASWYGRRFHGRLTASGEPYDMAALTAAHRSLPFGSRVRVTNLADGRSVVVVINDRGPYADGRLIDLSHAAARRLGMLEDGVAEVRIDVLADAAG